MIAVLGGLGAALAWATSTLCASRASRRIGAASTVAWIAIIGSVLSVPMVVGRPLPTLTQCAWLAAAGVSSVLGLILEYRALRLGQVGVITPIASTEGAIAAMIAVAAGEAISPVTMAALLVIAAGIVLVAWPSSGIHGPSGRVAEGSVLAAAAAVCFGISLYTTGHVSYLAIGWLVIPTRLVGLLFVALPLLVSGRLKLARAAAPLVLVSGICEVIGISSYALGARHSIAIAAVIASLFAVFSVIGAYVLFSERLAHSARIGVVITAVGVATISAIH